MIILIICVMISGCSLVSDDKQEKKSILGNYIADCAITPNGAMFTLLEVKPEFMLIRYYHQDNISPMKNEPWEGVFVIRYHFISDDSLQFDFLNDQDPPDTALAIIRSDTTIFKQTRGFSMNYVWKRFEITWPFDPRENLDVCRPFTPTK